MYKCSKCWYSSPKWVWKCPECNSWNTLEEITESKNPKKWKTKWDKITTSKISNKEIDLVKKSLFKSEELNTVLGSWLTPWSLILLSWEPWIWKSTLALQMADWYANDWRESLYISSEENVSQLSQRALRLWINNEDINIISSSFLEDIIETIESTSIDFIIIDSISIISSWDISSSSWSVGQIKYITERLLEAAKTLKKSIVLIWHITKDWSIWWPKLLEHLVDTVLYLEWSRYETYRILRALKNRFWPTDEVWLFSMTEKWLIDLKDPWMEFINKEDEKLSGSALAMTLEWNRPMLIEIEALTTYTKFWYPKRSSRWIPSWKLDLLIAILTKFTDVKLDSYDVYINVSRWINSQEPWIDLATIAAIVSSKKWKPLWKTVFIWEVSLTWIAKNVMQLEKRINESMKLWFDKIIIPANIIDSKKLKDSGKLIEIKNIKEIEKLI